MQKSIRPRGTLTLIGSGEFARSMGKVYRAVISRIAGSAQAVFLDTPAGFELNADQISAKAVTYFKKRLQTDLDVVSFKSAADATRAETESALQRLRTANLIFAGPGSPTYAVRNWCDTEIYAALVRRLSEGAHVVLASAAAIAIGRYALPVYEIYKVGDAPHWVEGLDLLGSLGLEMAIVPHWNNAEGGTHDTRYCFMGAPRMKVLEACLPDPTIIVGIDEYTACILDLASGTGQIMGIGRLTVRQKGRESIYPSGTVFGLDQLLQVEPSEGQDDALRSPVSLEPIEGPPGLAYDQAGEATLQPDVADDAIAAEPFIELLVAMRAQLRANEQWALADEIRQRLAKLGIVLEDGPTETTWRRE